MPISLRGEGGDVSVFAGLPPGYAAGFTLRAGGLDQLPPGPLGRRLAAALGAAGAVVCRAKQVHGAGVLAVDGTLPAPSGVLFAGEGDALVTRERGRLLVVSTADCVPILLLDEASGVVAAVHAGWRGTAERVVDAALDAMLGPDAPAGSVVALFGPSISRAAYEVGPEVVAALERAHGGRLPEAAVAPGRGDRLHVDVALVNEEALLRRGVARERIFRPATCTLSEADRFPSYRRDGERAGRIVSGIVRTAG